MCRLDPIDANKNSKVAGVFSVIVLFMLTGLGLFAVLLVSDPSHYAGCATNRAAVWVLANFIFSIFGGGIGAVYELYLVCIDKVFEVETMPMVPRIRGFNAGYIFTVGLLFDAFMVIGPNNPDLLNTVVLLICITGPLFAPGLAFSGKQQSLGNAYFGGTTLLSMLLIFFNGCAFGGSTAKLLLSGSKLLSALGAILSPPNISLRTNIQFHILRFIANCMVLVSYTQAHGESPCFPQESQAQLSSNVLPVLGASVALGWATHLHVASSASKQKVL